MRKVKETRPDCSTSSSSWAGPGVAGEDVGTLYDGTSYQQPCTVPQFPLPVLSFGSCDQHITNRNDALFCVKKGTLSHETS